MPDLLKALYDYYTQHQGQTGEAVCQKEKIIIKYIPDMPIYYGLEIPGHQTIIALSLAAKKLLIGELILWHEFGHFLIRKKMPWPFFPNQYPAHETWCDNFGLAMVLAQFNIFVLTKDNYQDFLTDGEGLYRLDDSNAHLRSKLLHIIETDPTSTRLQPLIDLADQL